MTTETTPRPKKVRDLIGKHKKNKSTETVYRWGACSGCFNGVLVATGGKSKSRCPRCGARVIW